MPFVGGMHRRLTLSGSICEGEVNPKARLLRSLGRTRLSQPGATCLTAQTFNTVSLLSRHLRAEEGTTDAPRYDAIVSATGDSPQTHQGSTGRASNQITRRKGTIILVKRLFRSRHLRAEEGTTDAPRCHSTMRPHATHRMPSGARSVPCPCFN